MFMFIILFFKRSNDDMKKPNFLKNLKFRLPRINVIIGKKHIIVAGLALLLGAAIYVNYIYMSSDNLQAENPGQNRQPNAPANDPAQDNEPSSDANYGDAAFVSNNVSESDLIRNYFIQARLDLQESRDEAKEFLQAMYQGGDTTSDGLEVIARDAQRLQSFIESETKVENLLKAQGFEEALVYLSERGANIIVKTPGLDAAGAARIKSTLLSEVTVAAENITIVEIN
jgi:stage III sporulation protein AH